MVQTTEPEVAVMNVLNRVVEGATVRTVFGEPITRNGVSVVPVAKVRGAGGGGGGSGTAPNAPSSPSGNKATGSGTGGGLALTAEPVGVFVIKGDTVAWRPSVDAGRVILGAQVVAVVALLTLRAFLRWRRR